MFLYVWWILTCVWFGANVGLELLASYMALVMLEQWVPVSLTLVEGEGASTTIGIVASGTGSGVLVDPHRELGVYLALGGGMVSKHLYWELGLTNIVFRGVGSAVGGVPQGWMVHFGGALSRSCHLGSSRVEKAYAVPTTTSSDSRVGATRHTCICRG